MTKKKYLFILSILLFLFLLGSYGTCYAWSYEEVKGTIENVIIDSGIDNVYLTNLNTWIHSEVSEEWQPIFSSYDNFIVMCNYATITDNISYINSNIIIYAWENPDTTYNIYEYKSGSNWILKTTTNITRVRFAGDSDSYWNNGQYYHQTESVTNTNLGFGNRNNPLLWVIFTNKTIGANALGGIASQNWLTYNKYIPIQWTFTPSTTNKATINGSQWEYYIIDNTYDQYNNSLGTIKNSLYVRQLELQWSTWDSGQKKYVNQKPKIVYDYDKLNSIPLTVYYSGTTTKISERFISNNNTNKHFKTR